MLIRMIERLQHLRMRLRLMNQMSIKTLSMSLLFLMMSVTTSLQKARCLERSQRNWRPEAGKERSVLVVARRDLWCRCKWREVSV